MNKHEEAKEITRKLTKLFWSEVFPSLEITNVTLNYTGYITLHLGSSESCNVRAIPGLSLHEDKLAIQNLSYCRSFMDAEVAYWLDFISWALRAEKLLDSIEKAKVELQGYEHELEQLSSNPPTT